MTIKSRPRLFVMGGLLALVAVACNSTLDDARLEQVITEGIQTQTGVTLTSIDCPSGQPLVEGNTFNCVAVTPEGSNLQITVTQTDGIGNVHWEITGQN
jgi:hypothetical protein